MRFLLQAAVMAVCLGLSLEIVVDLNFVQIALSEMPSKYDDLTTITTSLVDCARHCISTTETGSCSGFQYVDKHCFVFRDFLVVKDPMEPFLPLETAYIRSFDQTAMLECFKSNNAKFRVYDTPTGSYCLGLPVTFPKVESIMAITVCEQGYFGQVALAINPDKIKAVRYLLEIFLDESVDNFWAGMSYSDSDPGWETSDGQVVGTIPSDMWVNNDMIVHEGPCAIVTKTGLLQDTECWGIGDFRFACEP